MLAISTQQVLPKRTTLMTTLRELKKPSAE
jgi:hypothetical protein